MFILVFISFSDFPSSVIRAPRYENVWTFSISFPSMCILVLGGLLLLENTIVFVFFAFIRSPKLSPSTNFHSRKYFSSVPFFMLLLCFLSVWLIHFHRLFTISSLRTLSFQLILRSRHRHFVGESLDSLSANPRCFCFFLCLVGRFLNVLINN